MLWTTTVGVISVAPPSLRTEEVVLRHATVHSLCMAAWLTKTTWYIITRALEGIHSGAPMIHCNVHYCIDGAWRVYCSFIWSGLPAQHQTWRTSQSVSPHSTLRESNSCCVNIANVSIIKVKWLVKGLYSISCTHSVYIHYLRIRICIAIILRQIWKRKTN